MMFAGTGGMLFLLMFPVVTMGFYQGPLGVGGRIVGALAGLAFMAAALAAGTGAGFTLLSTGSLLMGTGAALVIALHVHQKRRGWSETPWERSTGDTRTASPAAFGSDASRGGP